MKKRWFAAISALMMSMASALGADFYLKTDATDWSVASSYCTDSARTVEATSVPGAGDSIRPADVKYTIDCGTDVGLNSFNTLKDVAKIIPDIGAELEFVIPADQELAINALIRRNGTQAGRIESTLTKKGAGSLVLQGNTAKDINLYSVNFDVKEGKLKLPETDTSQYYGWLKVATGAEIWLTHSASSASQSHFHTINTEVGSLITNSTTRTDGHVFKVATADGVYRVSHIYGNVGGNIRLWTDNNVYLHGNANTMSAATTIEGNYGKFYAENQPGTILVDSFGMKADAAKSIGAVNDIMAYSSGGGFRYMGTGETTDIGYRVHTGADRIAFLDGGEHGALNFAGAIKPSYDNSYPINIRRFFFTGSHENDCIFSGPFDYYSSGTTVWPMHITKHGTGVWRFDDNPARFHLGGTTIADGTLKFASIADKGMMCSLGLSTLTTLDKSDVIETGDGYTDYAFTLGGQTTVGETTTDNDPVFEYVGTRDVAVKDRPIALAYGGGHLRNSTEHSISLKGVYARDENATPTLTLDGDGPADVVNTVKDVTDSNKLGVPEGAKVSVVKNGSGTWKLGGKLSFSGSVKVNEGKLSIDIPTDKDYKWYRLSVAEIGGGGSDRNALEIRQIALFSEDGTRQNVGLTALLGDNRANEMHDVYTVASIADIPAGYCAYDPSCAGKKIKTGGTSPKPDYDLDEIENCFRGGYDGNAYRYVIGWYDSDSNALAPTPNDPTTWIPIVMHLKADAAKITHFDIQGHSNQINRGLWPTRIRLEASEDGRNWAIVFSNVERTRFDYSKTGGPGYSNTVCNVWLSDGKVAYGTTAIPAASRKLDDCSWKMIEPSSIFSWFRLSFARIGLDSNPYSTIRLREICLYDKEGVRQNANLTPLLGSMAEVATGEKAEVYAPDIVGEGEVAFDPSVRGYYTENRTVSQFGSCFSDLYKTTTGYDTYWDATWYRKGANGTISTVKPDPNDRSTWIPLVMHLVKGSQPITHFDIQMFGNGDSRSNWPTRMMLEGSTDGVNWQTVFNNATEGDAFDYSTYGSLGGDYSSANLWLSDGSDPLDSGVAVKTRPYGNGWNVTSSTQDVEVVENPLANVSSVQVLSGAEFSTPKSITLNSVTVDATDAGTIKGFDFASSGTLDIKNLPSGGTTVLPGSFENCTNVDNLENWSVKVDGTTTTNRKITVKNGQLVVTTAGLLIIVR